MCRKNRSKNNGTSKSLGYTALAERMAITVVPLTATLEAAASMTDEDLLQVVLKAVDDAYEAKLAVVGKDSFAGFERNVMLQSVDTHWREHLAALDHLRQGIHLRGYAQKNPKQEYKREAFELFGQMLDMIKNEVVKVVMTVRIQSREEIEQAEELLAAPPGERALPARRLQRRNGA